MGRAPYRTPRLVEELRLFSSTPTLHLDTMSESSAKTGGPVRLWLTILAWNATIAPEQVPLIVVSLSAPFGSRRSWPSNATA